MGLSQKLDTPKIQWGIIMNHHSSTFKWLIDEYLHVSPVFSPKSSRRVWGVPKGRDVPGWLSNVAANYTLMQSWCNINAILMQFSKIYYQPININFIGIPDFLDQWWPMDLCIRINDFLSVICHSSLRGMVEHSFPGAHHSRERNSLVDWGRPCPDWLRKVRDQALWVKCWSAGFSQTLSAFALLLHVSKPPLA